MFLKGCETYGLKSQDLFQVNDLYENKGLYLVVDCLFACGGMVWKIASFFVDSEGYGWIHDHL